MHFTRKLKYFIDNKVAEYIFRRYPRFVQFLHGFIDFLESEVTDDMMNMTSNLITDTMSSKLVQQYFEQLCKGTVDSRYFILPSSVKKELMNICKMWYRTKGRMFSLNIVLQYLGKYFISPDGTYIGDFAYEIEENVNFWFSKGSIPYLKPYTYIIRGDVPIGDMSFMLKSVNPVGYSVEFSVETEFKDIWDINNAFKEIISISTNYVGYNFVDTFEASQNIKEFFGLEGKELLFTVEEVFNVAPKYFRYDGSYTYNGHLDGNNTVSMYNAMNKGIYEDYSYTVYKNGEAIETVSLPIGRMLP